MSYRSPDGYSKRLQNTMNSLNDQESKLLEALDKMTSVKMNQVLQKVHPALTKDEFQNIKRRSTSKKRKRPKSRGKRRRRTHGYPHDEEEEDLTPRSGRRKQWTDTPPMEHDIPVVSVKKTNHTLELMKGIDESMIEDYDDYVNRERSIRDIKPMVPLLNLGSVSTTESIDEITEDDFKAKSARPRQDKYAHVPSSGYGVKPVEIKSARRSENLEHSPRTFKKKSKSPKKKKSPLNHQSKKSQRTTQISPRSARKSPKSSRNSPRISKNKKASPSNSPSYMNPVLRMSAREYYNVNDIEKISTKRQSTLEKEEQTSLSPNTILDMLEAEAIAAEREEISKEQLQIAQRIDYLRSEFTKLKSGKRLKGQTSQYQQLKHSKTKELVRQQGWQKQNASKIHTETTPKGATVVKVTHKKSKTPRTARPVSTKSIKNPEPQRPLTSRATFDLHHVSEEELEEHITPEKPQRDEKLALQKKKTGEKKIKKKILNKKKKKKKIKKSEPVAAPSPPWSNYDQYIARKNDKARLQSSIAELKRQKRREKMKKEREDEEKRRVRQRLESLNSYTRKLFRIKSKNRYKVPPKLRNKDYEKEKKEEEEEEVLDQAPTSTSPKTKRVYSYLKKREIEVIDEDALDEDEDGCDEDDQAIVSKEEIGEDQIDKEFDEENVPEKEERQVIDDDEPNYLDPTSPNAPLSISNNHNNDDFNQLSPIEPLLTDDQIDHEIKNLRNEFNPILSSKDDEDPQSEQQKTQPLDQSEESNEPIKEPTKAGSVQALITEFSGEDEEDNSKSEIYQDEIEEDNVHEEKEVASKDDTYPKKEQFEVYHEEERPKVISRPVPDITEPVKPFDPTDEAIGEETPSEYTEDDVFYLSEEDEQHHMHLGTTEISESDIISDLEDSDPHPRTALHASLQPQSPNTIDSTIATHGSQVDSSIFTAKPLLDFPNNSNSSEPVEIALSDNIDQDSPANENRASQNNDQLEISEQEEIVKENEPQVEIEEEIEQKDEPECNPTLDSDIKKEEINIGEQEQQVEKTVPKKVGQQVIEENVVIHVEKPTEPQKLEMHTSTIKESVEIDDEPLPEPEIQPHPMEKTINQQPMENIEQDTAPKVDYEQPSKHLLKVDTTEMPSSTNEGKPDSTSVLNELQEFDELLAFDDDDDDDMDDDDDDEMMDYTTFNPLSFSHHRLNFGQT